jgi:hypothetical protein
MSGIVMTVVAAKVNRDAARVGHTGKILVEPGLGHLRA